uniref:Leucine-rich repeat-containing protein 51 n=1 Tax=Strombidium rassoulzadegani TaxID=1082188 RepID=A0A7S3FUK3_9SPIT|mmetsp:Transcript_17487/g.29435  ORF Transcript_17487/g.29435 Transcript_17487/m.29435 type:complete len:328 (+) Transcript_17487:55-1038(+)
MDEQDYELYVRVYDEMRLLRRKPQSQATVEGKIDHFGTPLDFSFLKLQDVQSLRKETPRAGKRKPIEKEDDEEDAKKGDALNALNEDKLDGDKPKDSKETMIIRNIQVPSIVNILATHSVSLQATKVGMIGSRKQDDGKEESQRKKEINYSVNSLFLNNNEIRDLSGLFTTLSTFVLYEPDKLQWLNLSYNYLIKVDHDILNFSQLKSLQLHGNYINDLEEIRKLNEIGTLQTLTLNGNPIEEIKGYRLFVLGLMYQRYETLKRLDTVLITKMEFDNVIVWNKHLNAKIVKRLRKLRPSKPKQPPAKEVDENAKNGVQGNSGAQAQS